MVDLLSIYYHLPYPLKVVFASARGCQLHWWRYGKETEQFVEEAFEREKWTNTRWKNWREERLAFVLDHAATQVPYYRNYWQKLRRQNNKKSWSYLENWPILQKETVRNNPKALIADSSKNKNLYIDHTGGTTGNPTLIYESRASVIKWYALLDARLRRWYGANYKEKWGMFGGQRVVSLAQKTPPYWVRNESLHQLYFSVFHVTRNSAKYYVNALHKFSPTYLIVYPSILATLSHYLLEQRLSPPKLKAIFCNSEKVLDSHRALIQAAFDCPVVDTYGMAEMTSAGSECEAGIMHEWPEVGYLEVFNRDEHRFINDSAELGDFVMTGLLNEDMPLIRYRNGDVGSLPDQNFKCMCGRLLPKFGSIVGRANDLIQTPDGRKLYILDSLFNGLPIFEAQLLQENIDNIKIILVPDQNFSEENEQALVNKLRQYVGDIHVDIEQVERIPRDGNGKFRPYISLLNK